MKIRITKKPVKKYQIGGEPRQEDFPDYGSYKSAYDAWVASGATSAMQNFQQTPNAVSPAGPSLVPAQPAGVIPQKGSFLQLSGPQAPNYAWTSFGQAPTVPTPRVTTVAPDGTKTTTGNIGTPTVQYQTNNVGTPASSFPIVPLNKRNKSAYARGYDAVMDPFRTLQKGLQKPFMQDVYGAASAVNGIVDLALPIATYFDNESKIRQARENAEINRYNSYSPSPKFRGNFTINEGLFRPDDRGVNEGMFGNNFYGPTMAMEGGEMFKDSTTNIPMKIRIKSVPKEKMEYGGQSGYGLDLGRRKVYTDMPKDRSEEVSNTMPVVPRQFANVEAERGETVFGDLDGDGALEHKKIEAGNRHSSGGAPINVPEGSFIFSDTKKMKIKDPEVLAKFGMTFKKGGYTPAAIAKKFPINKYKAVLMDKNADPRAKRTAELNYNNGQQMLGMLSVVQEGMKDFPQGMPAVAESIMGATNMAYGGYYLPKFQGATGSSTVGSKLGEWEDDYAKLSTLLMDPKNAGLRKAMFQEFLKDYPNSPLKKDAQGEKKFVDNFLNAQQQFMALNTKFKDKPEYLTSEEWDKYKDSRLYRKEMAALGYTPMSEREIQRFQGGYRAMMRALKKDPSFIESFGKYFDLNPTGVADEPEYLGGRNISLDDKIAGNTTIKQFFRLRNDVPGDKPQPGFLCDPATGKAVPVPSGGYKTEAEALKNCPTKQEEKPKYLCIDDQVVESPYGYTTREEAGQNCGKKGGDIPFDFTLPDKMNIGWKAAMAVPEVIMPTKYNMPARTYPLALDDWMARAQNRQSTYNAAMDTAAATNQSQAVGSFLAGLVGAQDVNDIADVNSRNIDRVDRRTMMDAEMDFKRDLQSYMGNLEYDKGVATARQQYRNSLNAGVNNFIDAYGKGFFRRGEIYDRNRRSKYFYRDPNSWKTIFKGNPVDIFTNPDYAGGADDLSGGGYGSLGTNFNTLYSQFYNQLTDPKLTDEQKRAQAQRLANLAISTSAQRNTRTFDQLGMPRATTQRSTYYPQIADQDEDYFGYGGMFGW